MVQISDSETISNFSQMNPEGLKVIRDQTGVVAERQLTQQELLSELPVEDIPVVKQRLRVLSSLAQFVGQNLKIPVEIAQADGGWGTNAQRTALTAPAEDLVNADFDQLRHQVSTEAGRVRISRMDAIESGRWEQPGYAYLTEFMEKARGDNYVAEHYPRFAENLPANLMIEGQKLESSLEAAEKTWGFRPRFMQAGQALYWRWYEELTGKKSPFPLEVSQEVQSMVEAMAPHAHDAWWLYPAKPEADADEGTIDLYAQQSRQVIDDLVWPLFEQLVALDLEDLTKLVSAQDLLTDADGGQQNQDIPTSLQPRTDLQDLVDLMQPKELSAEVDNGQLNQVDSTITPEPLAPVIQQSELFQAVANSPFASKLAATPDVKTNPRASNDQSGTPVAAANRVNTGKGVGGGQFTHEATKRPIEPIDFDPEDFQSLLESILQGESTKYVQEYLKVQGIIEELENQLRRIFTARRQENWEAGFRTGMRLDFGTIINESARGISVHDSVAWKRRELPTERDYAFSILLDVTTSMLQGNKLSELFSADIILAEVLNILSVNLEQIAFNDDVYPLQRFGEPMTDSVRLAMENMLQIPKDSQRRDKWGTATGWAVRSAVESLAKQVQTHKFMLVITDGKPDLPGGHPKAIYNLHTELATIKREHPDIQVIGISIGESDNFIGRYFDTHLSVPSVQNLREELIKLLLRLIEI